MTKEEFIDSKMKLSKEDIIYDYYKCEEKLIEKIGIEHENYELKQENQQLKECYCNRTDCSGRIKNSRNYDSLYQKYNKQLDNWNKLKEDLNLILDYSFGEDASSWDKIYGEHAKATLKFMEELEQGSGDSNGRMEKR